MSGKLKGIFKKAAKQHGLHNAEFMKVLAISQFHQMTFLFTFLSTYGNSLLTQLSYI